MEDFVPFKLAKKLKEKGFDEACYYYEPLKQCLNKIKTQFTNTDGEYYGIITAPTISQVLKWLREEKEFMVFPVYSTNTSRWYCSIVNADSLDTYKLSLSDSYEEAALAGIEYVLDNLI